MENFERTKNEIVEGGKKRKLRVSKEKMKAVEQFFDDVLKLFEASNMDVFAITYLKSLRIHYFTKNCHIGISVNFVSSSNKPSEFCTSSTVCDGTAYFKLAHQHLKEELSKHPKEYDNLNEKDVPIIISYIQKYFGDFFLVTSPSPTIRISIKEDISIERCKKNCNVEERGLEFRERLINIVRERAKLMKLSLVRIAEASIPKILDVVEAGNKGGILIKGVRIGGNPMEYAKCVVSIVDEKGNKQTIECIGTSCCLNFDIPKEKQVAYNNLCKAIIDFDDLQVYRKAIPEIYKYFQNKLEDDFEEVYIGRIGYRFYMNIVPKLYNLRK